MRSPALRLTRQVAARRYASTTPSTSAANAASKAKEQAAATASKAREQAANLTQKGLQALSKAGPVLAKASESFTKLAASTGGRTGRLLKAVEVYYSKVAFELSKIVFRGQKMTPPDLAAFQAFYKPFLNPTYVVNLSKQAIASARTAGRTEAIFVGVLTAEVLGFFTVGEIIGRRKLVGYRGEPAPHH